MLTNKLTLEKLKAKLNVDAEENGTPGYDELVKRAGAYAKDETSINQIAADFKVQWSTANSWVRLLQAWGVV